MLITLLISLIAIIVLFLIVLTALQLISLYRTHHMKEITYDVVQPASWPTVAWLKSTPEKQGINTETLLDMIAFYEQKKRKNEALNIDSITIVRNGCIVADLYFNPLFQKDEKHIINSCAKSIVSILVGIAIDKGYIKSVDTPILDFFDDINLENANERLKSLTVKSLLTMRTGWHSQDSYLYLWQGLFKMQATDHWTEHILNLPFETNPNTHFDYSNMASFLLSAIVTKVSGMSVMTFAKKYLFTPLGIEDILWDKNPRGIHIGFARMWLKPHDMAKIGLLYLQKGNWEGKQLVSQAWVTDSIKAHSFPRQYKYIYKENNTIDFGASGGNFVFTNLIRPFSDGYGYQWWLDKSGIFSAIGVGGQYIMVAPKEQILVVVTSKLKSKDFFFPVTLFKKFILPAIESSTALPARITAQKILASYSVPPSLQREKIAVTVLPSTARSISKKLYSLDTSLEVNPWQYDNLKLSFEPDQDYATFSYTLSRHHTVTYKVGLNNQYQFTTHKGKSYAALGAWISSDTFEIMYEIIGFASKGKWQLAFKNERIEVKEIGVTGEHNYTGVVDEPKLVHEE